MGLTDRNNPQSFEEMAANEEKTVQSEPTNEEATEQETTEESSE
jgi:hypothetical protein